MHDIPDTEVGGKTWGYELLVYEARPENVKRVFGAARDMIRNGSQPVGMTIWSLIGLDPATGKPSIFHYGEKKTLLAVKKHIDIIAVIHNAPLAHLRAYTLRFHALSPITTESGEGTFLDVPRWMLIDANSFACDTSRFIPMPGNIRVPVDVKEHNLDALAEMVDELLRFAVDNSDFAASFALVEQYSMHAVKAKGETDSAIPWREHDLLM